MDKAIDERLSQWKIYLANISSNLIELSDQTEFQIIKFRAKDTVNGYKGKTKVKAEKCLETLGTLWQYFALLSEAIEKAEVLYSKNSFFNNTENAIREILDGPSIVIVSEKVSIDNRSLLCGENSQKKVTLQYLLDYMKKAFEDLCKDVKEISQATKALEIKLSDIKIQISNLDTIAKKLGITDIPTFHIDTLKETESDPLQGTIELDKLRYSVEKYRSFLKSQEDEYEYVKEVIKKIKDMLLELEELSEKSKEVVNKASKTFDDNKIYKPVISKEVIKSLVEWLDTLEAKLQQGNIKAVKIGVQKLEQECTLKLKLERENYHYNSKDYKEWLDLKGQFKAMKIKAEVLTAKGLLYHKGLDKVIFEAEEALYSEKIDLRKCRDKIKEFELVFKS